MPAIPSTVTDGLDARAYTVSDTNWAQYTFPAWVRRVIVKIRGTADEGYWSRTASAGAFSESALDYNTIPNVTGQVIDLAVSGEPAETWVSSIMLAHGNASGTFEFELLGGGR